VLHYTIFHPGFVILQIFITLSPFQNRINHHNLLKT
jgi:hypothetical protein